MSFRGATKFVQIQMLEAFLQPWTFLFMSWQIMRHQRGQLETQLLCFEPKNDSVS